MSDFSSLLGLSGATLQRLGDAYEGYAAATGGYLRGQQEKSGTATPRADQETSGAATPRADRELVAGSCYVLAAIYRSIRDPGSSIPLFGIASGIYRRQNNSFWKLLAICGFNRDWLLGQEAGRVEGNPQEFFYELLRQYFLFNNGDENSLGRMLEYASSIPALLAQPVGNPPIALQEYISFIRGDIEMIYYSNAHTSVDHQGWAASLRLILQRSAEQLQLLQSNRFQWTNEIGLLPFEPDILATLLGLCVRGRNREEFRVFLDREEADGNPMVFLGRLALEMIEATAQ